ncbi:sugar ABC transporter substrate-binding protein [Anaerocolumna aminovalerica]|jgi:putative multiple sugar transport system substrate-binding protein|uniref:Putative multiple sugar transport system substrate-binding protein n=1 Tax=Anaerocolumna aminovalerica TaxID=1527 RepID=A0A1I5CUM8_9FIRM|nr:multiple monosaccharide ABC transporter substrate-binding protein [Anaerocolumna aminovalerica]MBU5332144.1 sugar-binding protein [Anaerocolumna aminovalerica]MDU6265485.1 multiple monosaccharide ABC transporter substrate-binding protein [Anaerocolumna aminovalerica]SFN90647.1 putative multiple sugar transport system substrate-binding protein [Anaerocolumna aminovalerica]
MKKVTRKLVSVLLAATMIISLVACAKNETPATEPASTSEKTEKEESKKPTQETKVKKIGVAMPTQSSQRWIQDGDNMKKQLEALGYEVDLQYAEDDVQAQVSQIENLITNGADCLVVAAVDSSALVNALAEAKTNNIPVIAYDRLLMDTDAVSYYATFDNEGVGRVIGEYIEEKMNLKTAADEGRTYNIEFFMGSPDDNNAVFLDNGIHKVLDPYLESGVLVCQSGQTTFDKTNTLRWSQETAQKRCEDILSGFYGDGEHLDIIASAFDGLSYGCSAALVGAGYTPGEGWPLITGQDAELMATKNIIAGTQAMSIFKDTRVLAEKCVTMVQAVLEGATPEINDETTYNNNVLTVPSYLCTPVAVDAENYEEILIQSSYYTADQLK